MRYYNNCFTYFFFLFSLTLHTEMYWDNAIANGMKNTVPIEGKCVIFQALGNFIIFIAGVDGVDELILADVMDCLVQVLIVILDGCYTESQILSPERFGKLCIAVDDMVSGGIIESLDPTAIISNSIT